MKTYIYTLEHPTSGEIRYVGKTINISLRLTNHLTNKTNTHCRCWIKSLQKENQLPILRVIDEIDGKEWQWLEKYWIEQFRQWGFNLTNHTKGGEGHYGFKASDQTRLKMSKTRKGRELSKEAKDKISLKNKGKIRIEKNKKKISNSLINYYEEHGHHLKNTKRGTMNNKLNKDQVLEIRNLLNKKYSTLDIAKIYNVSKPTIQSIKEGRTWQSIGEFKIIGKGTKMNDDLLTLLYIEFELKTPVKDIQNKLNLGNTTIAKYRKIWKQTQK